MSAEFEDEFVRQPYDAIAEHWDQTRDQPWPFCAQFLTDLPQGSFVIEVGCGNGRNLDRQDLFMHGCDNSLELLRCARARRSADFALADNLALPYRSGAWDAVLSISVLHHFSSSERRLQALRELFRILRGDRRGRLLLYVRSVERQERIAKGTRLLNGCPTELLIPWNGDQRRRYTRLDHSPVIDAAEPWVGAASAGTESQQEGCGAAEHQLYHRYVHLFPEAELRKLLEQVEGAHVLQWTQEEDNWVVVACRD
eukprot:EG_transcript_23616